MPLKPEVAFPICQDILCKKNAASDRKFWKREIDCQYQFYITNLRTKCDTKYITAEYSSILCQIKSSEEANVRLRKRIRMLKMELFMMYQRNAHDSSIIDALHEIDYEARENEDLKFLTQHRLAIVEEESNQGHKLVGMLKEEISLLRRKDSEDADLIVSLKPLEEELKLVLSEEKVKNHQQAINMTREQKEILNRCRNMNKCLEDVKRDKSSERLWVEEVFSSIFRTGQINHASTDSDASSIKSTQETEHFDVITNEPVEDLSKEVHAMEQEYCEYVAMKELLDSNNSMTLHLIYDNLHRLGEGMATLAEEYSSLTDVNSDIAFASEYMQRLEGLRKKQDAANKNENSAETALRMDQLSLILGTLLSEKTYIENSLRYFTSTLEEDFKAHCVMLQKTEEVLTKSAVEDTKE